MFKRLINLPFSVASRAARAYQEREDARTREAFGVASDPGAVGISGSEVSAGADIPAASVQVDTATVLGWRRDGRTVELLDVRDAQELAAGQRVPGATSMPMSTISVRVSELSWEHPVVVLCSDGVRSLRAVRFFRERGMEDTYALIGGLPAWTAATGS